MRPTVKHSRKIGSDGRFPVPPPVQLITSYKQNEDKPSTFWHIYTPLQIPLLGASMLISNKLDFKGQTMYLDERKDNGDWDIRPTVDVKEAMPYPYDEEDHIYFLYDEEWENTQRTGVYLFTTSDILTHFPIVKAAGEEIKEGNVASPLESLLENNVENFRELIVLLYHHSRADGYTELDLPDPVTLENQSRM